MQEIFDIINVPSTTRYWFMRTETGTLLETFLEKQFISIGHDSITSRDLEKLSDAELKTKIARADNNIDLTTQSGKGKASRILNRIEAFRDIKKDDVVIIPSEGSEYLSFGIVQSDEIYEEENDNDHPHRKRKSVNWIVKQEYIGNLSPKFYQVKRFRGTLYDISDWAADITDSLLHNLYIKNDNSHFVIRVNTDDPISWPLLSEYLSLLHDLLKEINVDFELQEDIESSTIKINLQSKGILNLAQKGIAIVFLAVTLAAPGCTPIEQNLDQNKIEQVAAFKAAHGEKIARIAQIADTFSVPQNTLR